MVKKQLTLFSQLLWYNFEFSSCGLVSPSLLCWFFLFLLTRLLGQPTSHLFRQDRACSGWYGCRLSHLFSNTFSLCDFACCCSVTRSCLTLCDPMDCSMPGFPVLHYLPEFAQTHVNWVNGAVQPSHPLLPPSPPQSFPASSSFPMSRVFISGGQNIRASASVSVLPMNIQGWFPLGLTGLIFLPSEGLSRVFSSTTVWKYQFFHAQPSLWSNSHTHTWLLEKPSFD